MLQIIKHFTFEAAHYLDGYKDVDDWIKLRSPEEFQALVDGNCARIHGHSYKLDIGISPKVNNALKDDMIMDFKKLKGIVEGLLTCCWDHQLLNDVEPFTVTNANPTAEQMVLWIVKILTPSFDSMGVKLTLVDLWETEDSHCRWTNE